MKYLWIEDFNNGQDEEELTAKWLKTLDIDKNDVIITKNLSEAFKHIKEKGNSFDAVLLDINLPLGDGKIYENELKGIITEECFNEYVKNKGSGSGLLAFYYLREKCNFPKERIAFFSANIGSDSPKKEKTELPEDITSAFEQEVIEDIKPEIARYIKRHKSEMAQSRINMLNDLLNKKEDVLKLKQQVENVFTEMPYESKNKDNDSVQIFDRAKKAFNAVGMELKHAYAKDGVGDDTNTNFKDNFVTPNDTPYINFRRNAIEMAEILLDNCTIKEKKYLKKDKESNEYLYKNMLRKILALPLEEPYEKNEYIKDILWDATSYIDSMQQPGVFMIKYKKEYKYNHKYNYYGDSNAKDSNYSVFECASHAVLKLTRNWIAHNKFNVDSYNIEFAAFVISIAFRFIFAIEEQEAYFTHEKKILESEKCKETDDIIKKMKKIYVKTMNTGPREYLYDFMKDRGWGKDNTMLDTDIYKTFLSIIMPLRFEKKDSEETYSIFVFDVFFNQVTGYDKEYLDYAYNQIDKKLK